MESTEMEHAEEGTDADERPEWAADLSGFQLRAESFADGGRIPGRFTSQGDELSPALAWGPPPGGARGLVLLVDEPSGNFTHWMVVGLPPQAGDLVEGRGTDPSDVAGGRALTSDAGTEGWTPPASSDGRPRRYRFRVLAVDEPVDLPASAKRPELDRALEGHVVGEAQLIGLFG